MPELKLIESH